MKKQSIALCVAMAALVALPAGNFISKSGTAETAACESSATGSICETSASDADSVISAVSGISDNSESNAAADSAGGSLSIRDCASYTQEDLAITEYRGEPFTLVNDGHPFFIEEDYLSAPFENYQPLDELGRTLSASGCLGPETMPADEEEREEISSVYPSGWEQEQYDFIDEGCVYNRCHLLMWALSDENANEENLITGTRYLNIDGMLPWETEAVEYIRQTGDHLLYRVTPVYVENELVCRGVLMEAASKEDHGEGLSFCVYCYNVQPGLAIDYASGFTEYTGIFPDQDASTVVLNGNDIPERDTDDISDNTESISDDKDVISQYTSGDGASLSEGLRKVPTDEADYVANIHTMKFHLPGCDSVSEMKEKNRQGYKGTREEMIAAGYEPCGNCCP